MATVQFNDVGRSRQSWVTEMTSLTRDAILKQIRKHGAVIGKINTGLAIQWAENGREADIVENARTERARTVGKIQIIRLSL